MSTRQLHVALILGSTREGRFGETVARWAGEELRRHGGFTVDVIDPLALDLPHRHLREDGPAVAALARRIARADAFVVVTPEYNHGYPAALKFLIDSVGGEWAAKPVAFVSYGGVSGGLRAVEQLRLVFAELHAVGIRDSVSFANAWNAFGDVAQVPPANGQPNVLEQAHRSMATMLAGLQWWGAVLRHGRLVAPYGDREELARQNGAPAAARQSGRLRSAAR